MYLYNYLLIKNIIGCGESPSPQPTLITKQFTENGTYRAADDNADGYSEVTVDVPDESKAVLDSLIDRSITTITSDVTSIGGNAFQNCKALTEANFPNVTSIEGNAFYTCIALTEVNFPKVTSIESRAFYGCKSIKYFDMSEVSGVPRISSTTFSSTTCIFLFRDQTQLDEYASATNWSALADRFQIKEATP